MILKQITHKCHIRYLSKTPIINQKQINTIRYINLHTYILSQALLIILKLPALSLPLFDVNVVSWIRKFTLVGVATNATDALSIMKIGELLTVLLVNVQDLNW